MGYKHSDCNKETIIHQFLKMQAQVKSTPCIKHGKPKVYCLYSKLKPNSKCCESTELETDAEIEAESGAIANKCGDNCSYILTQLFCVQIPITFDLDVDIDQGIVCCGEPALGPCKSKCKTCTAEETNNINELDFTNETAITDETYSIDVE